MAESSVRQRREFEELPRPPVLDGLPVVGNTLTVMRRPLEFLEELAAAGDIVRYRVAGQQFIAILDPEAIEQVLVSQHDRFRRWAGEEWGDTFAGYAREGLLLTDGEQWRRQRLLIQQAFTPDRIESYADAMVAGTGRELDDWADGATIDVREEMSALTLRILARTLFDLDIDEHGAIVRDAAAAMNQRANVRNISAFLPGWVPTPTNRRLHRTMGDFEALIDALIAERATEVDDHDDLLSMLLSVETEDGSTLSEPEVRDQLITFLFAGHETTALALTYALHELGRHPDIADRIRAELDEVTGGGPPSVTDLARLTYTEQVITETLRLYPPAFAIFREATDPVEIGGYHIPAGSNVTIPQIHVHRDGRYYAYPQSFRPERWTDAFEESLPEYAYFPFGGGPRHCIGMRFAMMELTLVLPTILSAVDLEPVHSGDLALEPGITLQPAQPIEATVHRRH